MKKAFAVIILMLSLLLMLLLGVYASLHTRYATPVVNFVLNQAVKQPVHVELVEYRSPYQFTFHGVELSTSPEPLYIETVKLWINQGIIWQGKIAIDSLLLSGFQLQQGIPEFTPSPYIDIAQLAVDHLDYSDQHFIARDLSFQIKQPQYHPDKVWPWYGELQLSAEQIYWRNEAFDNVLLDADLLPDRAQVYGLSFQWRGADIASQAEWRDDQWHIINGSVSQLNLDKSQWQAIQDNQLFAWPQLKLYIDRLDLLSANIDSPDLAFTAADITLEDIQLPFQLWQQEGRISLNAESLIAVKQQWLEPTLDLRLKPKKLHVDDLNVGFKQGYIQLQGDISPKSAQLEQLNISGVEWVKESGDLTPSLSLASLSLGESLKSLTIERLRIKRSQWIDLASQPKRQVSGLNITGRQLTLVQDGQLGLWQGELSASANSASIGELIAQQTLLEAHAKQGISYLDKLVMPLENGLLRAQGQMDLSQLSQPWQLKFHVDGLPVELLHNWYPLPLEVTGLAEVQFDLHGLGGDQAMFAHSLSGFANASFRELTTPYRFEQLVGLDLDPSQQSYELRIDDMTLNAERGLLTLPNSAIHGPSYSGEFGGEVDLVTPAQGKLQLKLANHCGTLSKELLSDISKISYQPCDSDQIISEKVIIPFE